MKTCSKCGLPKAKSEFYKGTRQCKDCKKAYTKKWKQDNPGYHLKNLLMKEYGLSMAEYHEMLEEQGHSCAICKKHQSETFDRLHVDHCHTTGQVRGLLCSPCNTALGLFQDNPKLMRLGAEYVEQA